ncbi:hypothetical protein N7501_009827 [Penicillium viridicatum]|nr:hypothetical protein N7501_009827 [Penicillium viridicatum]
MTDLENNTYPLYGPDEPPADVTLAISLQYPYGLVLHRYWKPMLGTSMAWFCYDFVTYPFGLFSSTIIEQLSSNNTTGQNIGYRCFPAFCSHIQHFPSTRRDGPGVLTFLCASESFPTPLRDHFLGFAAAVGKAGASIGTEVFFTPIQNSFDTTAKGQQAVFLIGAAFTVFLIPEMSREPETEEAKFRAYLEGNGYGVSVYGEALVVNARAST